MTDGPLARLLTIVNGMADRLVEAEARVAAVERHAGIDPTDTIRDAKAKTRARNAQKRITK